MSNKFKIIVADPPWSFQDSLKMSEVKRGASDNYNIMSIKQIKELSIKDIADPSGAILALWVPSSLLQEGLDVMKVWGFEHKQTYVWAKIKKDPLKNLFSSSYKNLAKTLSTWIAKEVKSGLSNTFSLFKLSNILSFGMGRLFRQTHEICLLGINNKKIYKDLQNKSQRSVSFGVNLKHSAKPEDLQDSLDLMFPTYQGNKIELFARRQRDGWVCIGNEAPATLGEDITISIDKLL